MDATRIALDGEFDGDAMGMALRREEVGVTGNLPLGWIQGLHRRQRNAWARFFLDVKSLSPLRDWG